MDEQFAARMLTAVPPLRLNRRQFLRSATAAAATVAIGGVGPIRSAFSQPASLPAPDVSGIEHVVVVMMENRSFDHFLGWLPAPMADRQA